MGSAKIVDNELNGRKEKSYYSRYYTSANDSHYLSQVIGKNDGNDKRPFFPKWETLQSYIYDSQP